MQQPGQNRATEKPEFTGIQGPFGGILSEIPSHKIEQFAGFADAQNVSFRLSQAMVRQSYLQLTAIPNPQEPILGIFDFFNGVGNRIQVVITPTRVLQWNGAGPGSWTALAGGPLTGTATSIYTASVVNQKLCFSQGIDKVQLWDGITAGFATAAAAAVPARYVAEVANHLVVAYTVEAGNQFPQRFRWTGSGDPTDWVSLNSGVQDLNNDLGPITGLVKLFQSGWIFQQWGIVQLQPTGKGTNPFNAVPVVTGKQKGNICPYSVALFNEQMVPYVGKDNIYVFSGNVSEPIGDFPVSGSRSRLGARSRIFADIKAAASLSQIYGFATTSIGGNPFNAYWLFIPNIGAWVFNFDEANWTKFTFDTSIATAGIFSTAGTLRIMDLVGTIQAQSWTPATLGANNPLDDFLFGAANGEAELSSFAVRSEMPWSLTTGPMPFGDLRHESSTSAIRLIIRDNASMTFTVMASNEKGDTQSKVVTIGSNTGKMLEILVVFPQITGMFLTINISGDAGQPVDISEITPIYTVANEYKTNVF